MTTNAITAEIDSILSVNNDIAYGIYDDKPKISQQMETFN